MFLVSRFVYDLTPVYDEIEIALVIYFFRLCSFGFRKWHVVLSSGYVDMVDEVNSGTVHVMTTYE